MQPACLAYDGTSFLTTLNETRTDSQAAAIMSDLLSQGALVGFLFAAVMALFVLVLV